MKKSIAHKPIMEYVNMGLYVEILRIATRRERRTHEKKVKMKLPKNIYVFMARDEHGELTYSTISQGRILKLLDDYGVMTKKERRQRMSTTITLSTTGLKDTEHFFVNFSGGFRILFTREKLSKGYKFTSQRPVNTLQFYNEILCFTVKKMPELHTPLQVTMHSYPPLFNLYE